MSFEWDARKAAINFRKHGVSFREAQSVFDDPRSIEFFDEKHSAVEDRFRVIGLSAQGRLLLIIHQPVDELSRTVRIISARRATKNEEQRYAKANP